MEDVEGNKIEGAYDLGTRKYNIKINNRYLVGFKENESRRGKGAYSNGVLVGLSEIYYDADIIVVSDKKEDAYIFDGRINMISEIDKILKNYGYLFYKIEIIEIED